MCDRKETGRHTEREPPRQASRGCPLVCEVNSPAWLLPLRQVGILDRPALVKPTLHPPQIHRTTSCHWADDH